MDERTSAVKKQSLRKHTGTSDGSKEMSVIPVGFMLGEKSFLGTKVNELELRLSPVDRRLDQIIVVGFLF